MGKRALPPWGRQFISASYKAQFLFVASLKRGLPTPQFGPAHGYFAVSFFSFLFVFIFFYFYFLFFYFPFFLLYFGYYIV